MAQSNKEIIDFWMIVGFANDIPIHNFLEMLGEKMVHIHTIDTVWNNSLMVAWMPHSQIK